MIYYLMRIIYNLDSHKSLNTLNVKIPLKCFYLTLIQNKHFSLYKNLNKPVGTR